MLTAGLSADLKVSSASTGAMHAYNAHLQNVRNNNHIRVPSFILSGAPFFDHSRTKMGTKAGVFPRRTFSRACIRWGIDWVMIQAPMESGAREV